MSIVVGVPASPGVASGPAIRWDGAEGGRTEPANGLADLVCRFETRAAGFERGDTEGTLKGHTLSGGAFVGTDAVTVR